MVKIKYFVFFDLETTGLPFEENNRTKITELSMVAVSRNNLLDYNGKGIPRVVHKLSLCFDPKRMVNWRASETTGLWNIHLENERPFDKEAADMIDLFLKKLERPVCLVAHNGYKFDYSLLNTHILKSNGKLCEDILCVDSLLMFKDILTYNEYKTPEYNQVTDITDSMKNGTSMEVQYTNGIVNNETPSKNIHHDNSVLELFESSVMITPMKTPGKRKSEEFSSTENSPGPSSSKRKTFERSPKNYRLDNIYEYIFHRPAVDAHRAECDCMILLECFTARAKEFVDWCDNNRMLLKDIKCMEVGKEFPHYEPKKSTARKNLYKLFKKST